MPPQYQKSFRLGYLPHWKSLVKYSYNFLFHRVNPYLQSKRLELGLPETQKALVILDMFKAHRCEVVQKMFFDLNIICIFVPANCTDQLQPPDLSVNKPVKSVMRKCFVQWYSEKVAEQLDVGTSVDSVSVGLQMSVVKNFECKLVHRGFWLNQEYTWNQIQGSRHFGFSQHEWLIYMYGLAHPVIILLFTDAP